MMSLSCILWWLRYRFKPALPHLDSSYWWRDTLIYNPKNFFFRLRYGFDRWARWGIDTYLTDQFLKISYWMGQHTHGRPCDILSDGETHEYTYDDKGECSQADKDYDERALKAWANTIRKIRFSHFYMKFIQEDEFGWMIENREDRKNAFLWARKKYWYVREFITWRWWLQMYTTESLRYDSKMNFSEIDPETMLGSITFTDTDKKTGMVVEDLPLEVKYPHHKLAGELKPQFEEGLNLFRKYYQNLWD